MYRTPSILRQKLTSPPRWLVWAGVSVVCAISGPYESLEVFGFYGNFLYWGAVVGVAIAFAVWLDFGVDALLGRSGIGVQALVQAAIFAPIYALGLKVLVEPFYEAASRRMLPYWTILLQIFAIYVIVTFIAKKLMPEFPPVATDQDAPFLRRLPEHLGTSLIRISSRDHYVEVVTENGQERILMRFADALEELTGLDGLRVHRSHWVCRRAVRSVVQDGGKVLLRLQDGSEVSVSRSYQASARGSGLY